MGVKSIAKKAFKANAITEEEYKQLLCVIRYYYKSLRPHDRTPEMRLIDAGTLQKVFIEECAQECSSCIYNKPWVRTEEDDICGDWQGCELIDKAPTIISCGTYHHPELGDIPMIDLRGEEADNES